MDIPLLFSSLENIEFLFIIIIAGILSKVIGVGFISKVYGKTWKESLSMGFFHSARLSLIIASVA